MSFLATKMQFLGLEDENVPCTRTKRRDFSLIESPNVAYLKQRGENMCVFYKCLKGKCEQNFQYQSKENRDVLDESMAQSILLALKIAALLQNKLPTSH